MVLDSFFHYYLFKFNQPTYSTALSFEVVSSDALVAYNRVM